MFADRRARITVFHPASAAREIAAAGATLVIDGAILVIGANALSLHAARGSRVGTVVVGAATDALTLLLVAYGRLRTAIVTAAANTLPVAPFVAIAEHAVIAIFAGLEELKLAGAVRRAVADRAGGLRFALRILHALDTRTVAVAVLLAL